MKCVRPAASGLTTPNPGDFKQEKYQYYQACALIRNRCKEATSGRRPTCAVTLTGPAPKRVATPEAPARRQSTMTGNPQLRARWCNPAHATSVRVGAPNRIRTCDRRLRRAQNDIGLAGTACDTLSDHRLGEGTFSTGSPQIAPVGSSVAARLLLTPVTPSTEQAEPALPERLLTVKEVAKRLRVCTATVYAHVSAGTLPCVRIGGMIRITRGDLERLLDGRWTC